MGIKLEAITKEKTRDLTFEFIAADGVLVVKTTNSKFFGKTEQLTINGQDFPILFNALGDGMLQFDASRPQVLYLVQIKDKKDLASDQRLAFYY